MGAQGSRSGRRGGPAPAGRAVRGAAVALLMAVLEDRDMLSAAVARENGPLAGLDGPARARAQRLASETLRHLARADALLKPYLRKEPPPDVRATLRLATVEIRALGAADHAAVDAAVALASSGPRGRAFGGMVNAVLRRVTEEPPERWASLPPPRLPGWLRGRLLSAYGAAAVARMEAAHAVAPPIDLTPRDDPAALAEATGGKRLPTGSVRLDRGAQVSALPGYDSGAFWVQDAAAALPARALAARAGERVLDLCAAPGGKTLQLAATGADVTALDISEARLGRLRDNLARTRLAARIVTADALDWRAEPFDAVLLDAPCSATGTIRRHPDLPHVKSAADLAGLKDLQARLIDRAVALTRPGGRLVFCTCSLLPDEGEAQAAAAMVRHPDLRPDPAALELPGVTAEWIGPAGLRLRPDFWPDRGGMDGFFVAAFRRGT